ncbi:hypothetical protein [Sphingobacterium corticibacter]|uniref:Uncharacterized protein n=1 Tax=Sphingobacterium corticibacter TaxID=2171749 RepID=A0A2T8HNP7_9SPHI|nr:hypothetical protein [Sphingobacterium corticibacter]PVH27033.1 hypothetical protein DC487_05400 [Sphingobacterium corticibacter]
MNTANYTNQIKPLLVEATGKAANNIFHPYALCELGFTDRGTTWSNTNEQYHSVETQLGTLCVVRFSKVFLLHGNKENHLDRITSVRMLTLFIEMLS